jgi:predicted nucleotidyltransferase
MKTDNVKLNKIQKAAFEEIRISLKNLFPIQSIILFGSFARGGGDPESDVDLLILTKKQINRSERHKITDLIFEINLKYGTNFSTLVLDKHSWENGIYSVLPIKEEILKEGVEL